MYKIQYIQLERLGTTTKGIVTKARRIPESAIGTFALKSIKKNRKRNEAYYILTEFEVHALLNDCAYVPKLYEVFESQNYWNFAMELCPMGTLQDFFVSKKEKLQTAPFAVCVAEMLFVIHYLHTKGIIHADIKLSNFLISDSGHVKLCDFGYSNTKEKLMKRGLYVGTVMLSAPETLKNKEYSFASDYWSVGICLYIMYTQRHPFCNSVMVREEYLEHLEASKNILPLPNKELDSLLKKLLVKNPSKRLGTYLSPFCAIRNHNFFKEIDWPAIDTCSAPPPFSKVPNIAPPPLSKVPNIAPDKSQDLTIIESIENTSTKFKYFTYSIL